MNAPHAAAAAHGDPPDVSFELPEAFENIPSPGAGPEQAEQWERYLDEALPSQDDVPDLPREEIKQQYTAMRHTEAAQGVIGSAVCCAEPDGQLTLAYLTVALAPSRHEDPVVAVDGLYRAQLDSAADAGQAADFASGSESAVAGRFTSPGRLVLAVDLPVGPAVTVVTRQIVTAAPTDDYPQGVQLPTGTVQVFIPTPAPHVAVLTLMSNHSGRAARHLADRGRC